jgi:hypothetical protein
MSSIVPLGSRLSGTACPDSESLKRWQLRLRVSLSQYMIFQERSVVLSWNCANSGQDVEWLQAIEGTPSKPVDFYREERVQ